MMRNAMAVLSFGLIGLAGHAVAAPLRIVCAERVWCAIAAEIGGADVVTTSILTSGAVDPHDFAPSPGVARAFANADLIVLNGGGFDPWADALVPEGAHVIRVARLPGIATGEAHLFYDPHAAAAFGVALVARLRTMRADDAPGIDARGRVFADRVAAVGAAITRARARTAGVAVASLEPVGTPLLRALGFRETAGDYAHAIMNGTEPSPLKVASLEEAIASHAIRILVVNAAFEDPAARRHADAARAHGVAVVSLSEALPDGDDWAAWMTTTISALAVAAVAP